MELTQSDLDYLQNMFINALKFSWKVSDDCADILALKNIFEYASLYLDLRSS